MQKGDRIELKSGFYYTLNNGRVDRRAGRCAALVGPAFGMIVDVLPDPGGSGKHYAVAVQDLDPDVVLDIWTSQDQFLYRRA